MHIRKLFMSSVLLYCCFAKPRNAALKKRLDVEAVAKILKDVLTKMKFPTDERAVDIRSIESASLNNFDDIVTYNGKDTLVQFFAPWCSSCKAFAPVFDELGEKLKDEDVAIVKMDGTGEVPFRYDVQSFPTLYWVPKNSKLNPIPYKGERDVDDLVKFVAEHASSELKGYDRKGNLKKAFVQ